MTRHKTPADSKDKMKRLSYVRRTVSQSIRSAVPRHRSPLQASLRARQGKEMAAKQGCVTREGDSGQAGLCLLTVEPLLVHDGAAAQGLIVLLVAHERVHAQDSCGDKGTSMTLLLWFETSWGPIFHMPGALLTETVRNMYTKCVKPWVIFILVFSHMILGHPTSPDLSLVVATDFQISLRSK